MTAEPGHFKMGQPLRIGLVFTAIIAKKLFPV
jgi:hypothetical protein